MLKILSKFFKRDLTSPSEPIDTDVSDDEILALLNPNGEADLANRKKHLPNFLRFITTHLGKTESQRLCRVVKRSIDETEDSFEAIIEGITSDDGQRRGQWFLIFLDWKSTDEISWQVNECLSAFGVNDRWQRDCESEFTTVPQALQALSEWLVEKGYALLHLETESDSYCCFILKMQDATTAADLAVMANLTLYNQFEFSLKND